jgi:hypothetical protein
MADPAPTDLGNITPADLGQMEQWFGGRAASDSGGGNYAHNISAGQGLGQSYLSMVPVYTQGGFAPPNPGEDHVFDTLVANGYLTVGGDASGNGNSILPGWRSYGVTGKTVNPGDRTTSQLVASGAIDPNMDVGPGGYGVGNKLQLAPPNPFGVNTIGQQNVHEILSPTQAPAAFGTSPFGPTVDRRDLAGNQDAFGRYIIPLIQIAMSAAMPAMMPAGAGLGALGGSLFGGAGGDIINSQNPITSIASNPIGSGISLASLFARGGLG